MSCSANRSICLGVNLAEDLPSSNWAISFLDPETASPLFAWWHPMTSIIDICCFSYIGYHNHLKVPRYSFFQKIQIPQYLLPTVT